MPLVLPKILPRGATLGLCAPSSPFSEEEFARGAAWLSALGYRLRYTPDLFEKTSYLAGSDTRRAKELHTLFSDPEVDAVWAVRGGYGAMRLLAALDYDLIRENPKLLIGFSDISALHLAFFAKSGLATLHGPQLTSLPKAGTEALESLWALTSGAACPRNLLPPCPTLHPGTAEGTLLVSNLSILSHLVGTPYLPDLRGAILAIEDVNEEPYRVDRMLTQLDLAGIFAGLGGLVLGRFTAPGEDRYRYEARIHARVTELLRRHHLPGIGPAPFGHIDDNHSLPSGLRVALDAQAGTLAQLDPLVA